MVRSSLQPFASAFVLSAALSLACGSGGNATAGPGTGGTAGDAGGATGDAGMTGSAGATGAGGLSGGAGAPGAGGMGGTGATGGSAGASTTGAAGASGAGGREGTAGSPGVGGRGGATGTAGRGGTGGAAGAAGSTGAGGGVAVWPGTQWFSASSYDMSTGLVVDANGNIYVSGETHGSFYGQPYGGMNDLFAMKLNSAGARQWAAQVGANGEEWSADLAIDRTGNLYLAGASWESIDDTPTTGGFEAVLVKFDNAGTRQWTRQFGTAGSDWGKAVATDAAGNVYIGANGSGALDGNAYAGRSDAFLVKFDGGGTRQWTRQFGTAASEFVTGVATDGAGDVYVAGYTRPEEPSAGSRADAFLVKYDAAGAPQWQRTLTTAADDVLEAVAVDAAGGIYVVGTTGGDLGGKGSGGGDDAFIAKYDAAGALLWTRQLGATGSDGATCVATDAAGNVYVAGNTGGLDPFLDGARAIFLAKYDSAGTFAWVHQTPKTISSANAVAVDPRGGIYLTGRCGNTIDGLSCGGEIYLIKFTAAGMRL